MARSEREGSRSGGEESDSEEQVKYPIDEAKSNKMSEYEKQRLSRIAENKARLEALGISKAANALLNPRKRKEKQNSGGEEDEDYRPGEGDDGDDEDEIDDSEEDDEFLGISSSVSRKRKKKATSTSKRKLVLSRKNSNRPDPLGEDDGDDDDLSKAIALSLQDSLAVAEGSHSTTPSKRRRNDQEAASWKKKKKKPELMTSKMQMTQDELVIYFYQFDEVGKGFITLRDVVKMATLHDFTWTDVELQDMIRCFDMDKDGKLSLDEFRKIVMRCRILKES